MQESNWPNWCQHPAGLSLLPYDDESSRDRHIPASQVILKAESSDLEDPLGKAGVGLG